MAFFSFCFHLIKLVLLETFFYLTRSHLQIGHTQDVQDMEEASQSDSQENKYFGRHGTFKFFINMNI